MPRPCAASLEICKAGLTSENMRFSYENSQYLVLELSRSEINTSLRNLMRKSSSVDRWPKHQYLLMELPHICSWSCLGHKATFQ